MRTAATVRGILAAACAVALATSCDAPRSVPPYLIYHADDLDASRADEAEVLTRRFANDWNLILAQWSRGELVYADDFSMIFFHDEKDLEEQSWLLWVHFLRDRDEDTYHVSLSFEHLSHHGRPVGMPAEDLDRFAWEFKNALEERFGLEFCRMNPPISLCDAEYARLETEREAAMRARYGGAPRTNRGAARTEEAQGTPSVTAGCAAGSDDGP